MLDARELRRLTTSKIICPSQNRELQIMRIVKHPNVVDLRAFFYSNGDKVRAAQLMLVSPEFSFLTCLLLITPTPTERRSLPESCPRIRARDSLPSIATLRQDEADHANAPHQALHVPTSAQLGLHSLHRHLSSRHQATESASQPCDWYPEAL